MPPKRDFRNTDQQVLGSIGITTPEDAADGAVDPQRRPRDPRLNSLKRKARSEGDNGDRINAVDGRERDRENARRQSDHNGRAATRDMLSANLQNLGARTRGNDACQWQPKTAHFWQLKTAHFKERTSRAGPYVLLSSSPRPPLAGTLKG